VTRVKVNYTDRWVGIWPPFVFYNPGILRERRISGMIWGGGFESRHPPHFLCAYGLHVPAHDIAVFGKV
jgi:hypothetical protein